MVDIVRVSEPDIQHRHAILRKESQTLREEKEGLKKLLLSRTNKDEPMKIYESSGGQLVEVRYKETAVTVLDKSEPDNVKRP
jgi:hypothetical protein